MIKCVSRWLWFKVAKEDEHFDALSLLLYYYYGGCIYLAVKQYEKALYFFEVSFLKDCNLLFLDFYCIIYYVGNK